jgi:NitT/TauT family transport system substrate-binding protein
MAKRTIKVGHLPITDHLILGAAKDRLDKAEESMGACDLECQAIGDWTAMYNALEKGDIDAGFVLAPLAMDLFKNGVGVKLLLFSHRAGSILVKNKHAGIEELADFKGKSVLIPYQRSVHNMLFHKLLAEAGLKVGRADDPEVDVVVEVMAPAMMPDILAFDEEGEVGGFIVAEPIGSKAVSSGAAEELVLSKDLWADHPCCVFVVREDVIGENRDAVQELTSLLVRMGDFVHDNPDEAARIGAAFLGQEEDVVRKVLCEPCDRITTNRLYPVVDDLCEMQDYMCGSGITSGKCDLDSLVDTSFAEEAGAKR